MRSLLISALLVIGSTLFCIASELKVGASPVPHAKILESIVPVLKQKGIDLKVIVFSDYVLPNIALSDKSIDANFMQHLPYLEKMNKDRGFNLVSIAQVHVEPLGMYSNKIKSLDELKNGASIAIPSDPSNLARALILLHNNGVITLKDPTNLLSTVRDIKSNPKKLKISRIEGPLLPKTLKDVDAAVINGNFALQAGLYAKDTIIIEDARSPYANILVVRSGDENRADILELKKALQSDEVRKFIIDNYHGEIVPAF